MKLIFTCDKSSGLDSDSRQRTEAQSSGTECQHQDLTKNDFNDITTSWRPRIRFRSEKLRSLSTELRCVALLRPFSIWSVRSFSSWRQMFNFFYRFDVSVVDAGVLELLWQFRLINVLALSKTEHDRYQQTITEKTWLNVTKDDKNKTLTAWKLQCAKHRLKWRTVHFVWGWDPNVEAVAIIAVKTVVARSHVGTMRRNFLQKRMGQLVVKTTWSVTSALKVMLISSFNPCQSFGSNAFTSSTHKIKTFLPCKNTT